MCAFGSYWTGSCHKKWGGYTARSLDPWVAATRVSVVAWLLDGIAPFHCKLRGIDSKCQEFGLLASQMLKEFCKPKSYVNCRSNVVLPPSVFGTSCGGGGVNCSSNQDGGGGRGCLLQAPMGRRWRSRNNRQERRRNRQDARRRRTQN
jgi:hypothetical protein